MGKGLKLYPPIASAAELRARLDPVFPGEELVLPPHLDAVLAIHSRLGDQRPATCGAYALSYLLPARGFDRLDGHPLADEDYMAHLAAVTIEAGEVAESAEVSARVAAGELTEAEARRRHPRTWYRFPMGSSADPAEVGTSPAGVARAIALGSGGRLAAVPVAGRGAGGRPRLDAGAWDRLLGLVLDEFAAGTVDVLFNYDTDQLLDARHPAYNAANLARSDAASVIPLDRWGVGHFVPLIGHWRRPGGERWLLILNSFKERAFAAVEPQPAELMRRAAVREDGRQGGVLLVTAADRRAAWVERLEAAGLAIGGWSNGSREPAGWRWSP